MVREVSLRKCGDHEDCQLQSIDGGEWEHTPAQRTLADRFAGRFDHAAAKRKLQEDLARADYLQRILDDLRAESASVIAEAKAEVHNLAKTRGVQSEAHKASEYLDIRLKTAQEAGERLERAFQRADSKLGQVAAILENLREAQSSAWDHEAKAAEAYLAMLEKLHQADTLLATLQERKAGMDDIPALRGAVGELSEQLQADVAALKSSERETRRQIEHERQERLAATSKALKSLQEHIKVSHG